MGAKTTKPNEINIVRIYDAPVKAVWDAWTDPDKVAKWWGPRGFTITTHSKDLRAGGNWNYTMHGPDGVDYPNKTLYYVVETYKKLVYDHGGHDDRPPLFRVTVLFEEMKGNKTKMDMTMALATPEAAKETKKFIKSAGGETTWDRLAEYLAKEGSGKEQFVINRSFNAPIKTMFEMWTKPEHFAKWLPPTGFTMEFMTADIREGGFSTYRMTDGGQVTMYGRADYKHVHPHDLLVYTQQFTDAAGKISRHPFAPTWPETMLTTVTFAAEDDDTTRVTVTWDVYGKATADEIKTFVNERPGMTGGWTGSFDKLEEYLTRVR